jgi:hypothetical protein
MQELGYNIVLFHHFAGVNVSETGSNVGTEYVFIIFHSLPRRMMLFQPRPFFALQATPTNSKQELSMGANIEHTKNSGHQFANFGCRASPSTRIKYILFLRTSGFPTTKFINAL